MNTTQEAATRCPDCGLVASAAGFECERLFHEVLAQHFSNPLLFGVHRIFVDAYCLQHPDRGCVSFKSFAAHATHLCWSLERGGNRAIANEQIRRWVERHPDLQKPPLPKRRGKITIAEIAGTSTPADHHRAVGRWAVDVWQAYSELHSVVRHWVDLAFTDVAACGSKKRNLPAAPHAKIKRRG